MKLNNKGMTMVEIIASVALVSIVLIFLLNLFLSVRANYMQSKVQVNYNMFVSDVTSSIGNDIEEYGLESASLSSNHKKLTLTFKAYRKTKMNEKIKKVLEIYEQGGKFYLSYKYNSTANDLTSEERVSGFVREIPDGQEQPDKEIHYETLYDNTAATNYAKIRIPLLDEQGNVYDINIYGKIVKST